MTTPESNGTSNRASNRTWIPSIAAGLLAFMAVSNASKAFLFQISPDQVGIVVFGVRMTSFASNLAVGFLMSAVLATYAYALWRRKSWAIPMSIVHAFYVPVNLVLFWYLQTGTEVPPLAFIVVYLGFALPGSIGVALYVAYHSEDFAA